MRPVQDCGESPVDTDIHEQRATDRNHDDTGTGTERNHDDTGHRFTSVRLNRYVWYLIGDCISSSSSS